MPTLTRNERNQLYLIAWQGASIDRRWINQEATDALVRAALVQKAAWGHYEATDEGKALLSSEASTATMRPLDYAKRSNEEQWSIDKRLGILDWDGS